MRILSWFTVFILTVSVHAETAKLAVMDSAAFYEFIPGPIVDLDLLKSLKVRFDGEDISLFDLNEMRRHQYVEILRKPPEQWTELDKVLSRSEIDHGTQVAYVIRALPVKVLHFLSPHSILDMSLRRHPNWDRAQKNLKEYLQSVSSLLRQQNVRVTSLSLNWQRTVLALFVEALAKAHGAPLSRREGVLRVSQIQDMLYELFREHPERYFAMAAGNDALPTECDNPRVCFKLGVPRMNNLLVVGARKNLDTIADYSNYGSRVDLFAMQEWGPLPHVISPFTSGRLKVVDRAERGTSFVTPEVAGRLAVYMAEHPGSNDPLDGFYAQETVVKEVSLRPDPITILGAILLRRDVCEDNLSDNAEVTVRVLRHQFRHDPEG